MELRMKLSEQILPESLKLFSLSKSAVTATVDDHAIIITPNYEYLKDMGDKMIADGFPEDMKKVILTSELLASTATILEQILYQLSAKYFKENTVKYSNEQMMEFVEKHKMYK